MLKTILIGLKDVRLAFRDRAALILMLAAPFVLTLGLGMVTGRFSGGASSALSDIPLILVNQDEAELGNALVDVFNDPALAELVDVSVSDDPGAARRLIDDDQAAAAVLIPAGFTRSIFPAPGGPDTEPQAVQIEVYANPARPTGAGVIESIVDEFVSRVEAGRLSGLTGLQMMIGAGLLTAADAQAAGGLIGRSMLDAAEGDQTGIALRTFSEGGQAVEFDVLAYIAPGMALLFLMYTVSYAGRTLLTERSQGTLPRLLVSPTSAAQILGGKVLGIFLTGALQLFILIGASTLFFGLKWGDTLGVIVLVLAAVFGATGWGMLITALARTQGQVATVGSALMLIFGILGGSFIRLENMPPLVQTLSKITPNAWGLDGFSILGLGGGLDDILGPITALTVMGALLFTAAIVIFSRGNLMKR